MKISEKDKRSYSNRKAQASMELIISFGFALLVIIPLTALLYEYTNRSHEDVSNNQAGLIARKITDAADSVYYLGHPSTTTIKVFMPEYIESINITEREIVFYMDKSEIVSTAVVNMSGNISASSGLKFIKISAMPDYVYITDEVE
jgi:uncharacterized protein (UPF0333 family)